MLKTRPIITFNCNPKLPEMTENSKAWQKGKAEEIF
jgi:hypothetical protein